MKNKLLSLLIMSILSSSFAFAQDEARLLRFPTLHDDQVVFSYGGDLYSVDADGGLAWKLNIIVGIISDFSSFLCLCII